MTPPLGKINVGSQPNDGTGDALRVAFQTTNSGLEAVDDVQTMLGVPSGTTLGDAAEVAGASAVGDTVLGRFTKHGGRIADLEALEAAVAVPEQDGGTYALSSTRGGDVSVEGADVTLQPLAPPAEGQQSAELWALAKYGTQPGIKVRARGTASVAHTPHTRIATASIPRYAFTDPVQIHVQARGEYIAGSSDPRLCFGFELGPEGSASLIRPEAGQIRGNVSPLATIADTAGIEASWRTLGENALGWDAEEVLDWRLDVVVEVVPTAIDKLSISGFQDGNVHVRGELVVSSRVTPRGANASHPGPSLSTVTDTYDPSRALEIPAASGNFFTVDKGEFASAHGKGYRSIWAQPRINDADPLTQIQLRQDAWFGRAPGTGTLWRGHWYELEQRVPVNFSDTIAFDDQGMVFSLMAGGPYQGNLGELPQDWLDPGAAPTNFYDPTLWRTDLANADSPVRLNTNDSLIYCARVVHDKDQSVEPGTGGEADRLWRLMSPKRQDLMTVYSTFASIRGGRVGVADFLTT